MFDTNKVIHYGGAISLVHSTLVLWRTLKYTYFINNQAMYAGRAALYCKDHSLVQITENSVAVFSGSDATRGGAGGAIFLSFYCDIKS